MGKECKRHNQHQLLFSSVRSVKWNKWVTADLVSNKRLEDFSVHANLLNQANEVDIDLKSPS